MIFLLYHCPALAATPSSTAGAYMPEGSNPLQGAADKTAGACLFSRQTVDSQPQVQCTQTLTVFSTCVMQVSKAKLLTVDISAC
jgi:hypothetical protein